MIIGLILIAALLSGALVTGRLVSSGKPNGSSEPILIDLPCPWCKGATSESDTACPSCGQLFGG